MRRADSQQRANVVLLREISTAPGRACGGFITMAVLQVITDEHPTLRKKAHKIKHFDPSLKKLAQDMFETMRAANGIGLAANQIDKLIRLFVVELTPDPEQDAPGSRAVRLALC